MTTSDLTTEAHGNGQYAEVNGIKLYFETHGAGRPNQPGGGVKF